MKICVVGSYGVGMTMYVDRVPTAGETVSGGRLALGPGGKGSNQAVAAARLGAKVSLLTALGDDSFGQDARALWAREGVDHRYVVTTPAATMAGFILVEASGENRIAIAPGALDELAPAHVENFRPEITSADVVVVSLEIPLETAVAALRIARQEGVTTLLNPAPAQKLPDEAWPYIDVLTPNATEAAILAGSGTVMDPDASVDALRTRFAGTIVLTLGGAGALLDDGARRIGVPPVMPRAVVDTTGAGDAFTGALAVELARHTDLTVAVRQAAAAGAWAVGIAEVIPALPQPADIESLLADSEERG
jgi:ribokinase